MKTIDLPKNVDLELLTTAFNFGQQLDLPQHAGSLDAIDAVRYSLFSAAKLNPYNGHKGIVCFFDTCHLEPFNHEQTFCPTTNKAKG